MELVYANNIFIIALLLTLMSMYFKKTIYLLLSIVLYFTYIVLILNNELSKINVIYTIFVGLLMFFLISKMFK